MKQILLVLVVGLGVIAHAWSAGSDEKSLSGDMRSARLTTAADAGDAEAQHALGRDLVDQGEDASKFARGVTYLERAAKHGHVYAMHDLAHLIEHGAVPGKTAADAFNWYRKAAEAGFAGSQNNLGDMYETGEGAEKSYGDAIHWYTRAAMQGEPTAYLSLGECYAKGYGVRRDVVQAYRWLLLAVKNFKNAPDNRAKANKTLKELELTMTPEQIAEGLKQADQYVPLRQTKETIGDPRR